VVFAGVLAISRMRVPSVDQAFVHKGHVRRDSVIATDRPRTDAKPLSQRMETVEVVVSSVGVVSPVPLADVLPYVGTEAAMGVKPVRRALPTAVRVAPVATHRTVAAATI